MNKPEIASDDEKMARLSAELKQARDDLDYFSNQMQTHADDVCAALGIPTEENIYPGGEILESIERLKSGAQQLRDELVQMQEDEAYSSGILRETNVSLAEKLMQVRAELAQAHDELAEVHLHWLSPAEVEGLRRQLMAVEVAQ